MNRVLRWGSAAVLALAATSVLAASAQAAPAYPGHSNSHAVFVQTDAVHGNHIVAYDRDRRGVLSQAGRYTTGGDGGTLDGAVVDHTASQGALTYDERHHLLYAVNAGSNTLSIFAVRGDRLDLRQVVASGGRFPVSVTVHHDLVYVLNALNGGSIQGYVVADGRLHAVAAWHRTLGLDPTATPQFTHTPGQVAFTPDGSQLVVTTKATTNAVDVFAVGSRGALAGTPAVTVKAGSVPFGVTFDRAGHLVVSETGIGAVTTYRIARSGTLTQLSSAATGQAATCWVTASGNLLYASNAGSASVSGFRSTGRGLTALGNTTTSAGTVDADVTGDGRFLYVQGGAAGTVDGFSINHDGSLTPAGSVTVPGAVGGEGIVAL